MTKTIARKRMKRKQSWRRCRPATELCRCDALLTFLPLCRCCCDLVRLMLPQAVRKQHRREVVERLAGRKHVAYAPPCPLPDPAGSTARAMGQRTPDGCCARRLPRRHDAIDLIFMQSQLALETKEVRKKEKVILVVGGGADSKEASTGSTSSIGTRTASSPI